MSRFLFSTFGSLGDLHPYIAVARELVARGHEAVIAGSEDYRGNIESEGIEFYSVGPGMTEFGEYGELVKKVLHQRTGPEYLIRSLIMPHVRQAYDQLLAASKGADLLISHPLSFTIPLVAETRGMPWVGTVLSPINFMSAYDPPLIANAPLLRKLHVLGPRPYSMLFWLIKRVLRRWEAPLVSLRKELGLAPYKGSAMFDGVFSPHMNLALFDPQLAKPQPDWPANVRVCGSPVYDGPDNVELPDELEKFLADGEAPIIFALGSSAVWIAGDFWLMAVEAVRRMGRRAVLITGPVEVKDLPEGIVAFNYLPYSRIFPRAAAVVHQAGIGTLAQALRAGRPQLIVPVAFDQPDNARIATGLGLARALPFRKVTSYRLKEHLKALLEGAEYSQAADRIAEELRSADAAARAADELLSCVKNSVH